MSGTVCDLKLILNVIPERIFVTIENTEGDTQHFDLTPAWQPIATFDPKNHVRCLWYLDWAEDVATRQVGPPSESLRIYFGRHRSWSSFYKATHWMAVGAPR